MRKALCIATIALVLPVAANAADKQVEDLLANMRKAYSSVKTVEFTEKVTAKGQMGEVKLDNKCWYAAPNKYRVETQMQKQAVTIVFDGKAVVLSSEKANRTLAATLDSVGTYLSPMNLEALCFFDWKKQLTTAVGGNMHDSTFKLLKESWNGKEWTVLEENAPKQKILVKYYIDPKTSLIWRTVVNQNGKQVSDGQIQTMKLNGTVSPAKFETPKKV